MPIKWIDDPERRAAMARHPSGRGRDPKPLRLTKRGEVVRDVLAFVVLMGLLVLGMSLAAAWGQP